MSVRRAMTWVRSMSGSYRPRPQTMQRQEALAGWLMALPALLLLLLFLIVPALLSLMFAFTDQRLIASEAATRFVGLRNFERLLIDSAFHQAFRNNIYFTVAIVPLQSGLALVLALLTNQRLPGATLFRTIYFGPIATSMVVVGIVWTLLFNPDGVINLVLHTLFFGTISRLGWLQDPPLAMPAILIVSIWQNVGFQMVIFLAGLQGIPEDLYDAAKVDGANGGQRFRFITLPGLRNTTVFILLTTTILSFRLYTQVEVMTQGGPRGATNTMVRYLVESGFRKLQIGHASAVAVLFLCIVLTIALIQRRYLTSERS